VNAKAPPRGRLRAILQQGDWSWTALNRREALIAMATVCGAAFVMLPIRERLGVLNEALIFLLLVLMLALRLGAAAAALASVVSFLLFDILLISPYYTFTVADPDHLLALFVYLGVAIVTGQLVSRLRRRTEEAERAERRALLLAELNGALIGGITLDAILAAIVERVVQLTSAASAQILTPRGEHRFVTRAGYPDRVAFDRQDLAVAAWVLLQKQPSGRMATAHSSIASRLKRSSNRSRALLMLPIATTDRSIGVLAIEQLEGAPPITPDGELVLMTFAGQAALAIERARLTEEAARSAALAQSDELKSALLAAVSHDLRTPLATIKASTTALLDPSIDWDAEARREFLTGIDEETDRLTLMVSNLLDLSRIEGGALKPDRDWSDGAELVNDVARRLRARSLAADRTILVDVPDDPPLLWLDYVEIAEVLLNLGDNSLKYGPPGTIVRLSLAVSPTEALFSVADTGPGMSERDRARVFTKFVRGESAGRSGGAGIGLSICKGLVEAHGGRIWIESELGTSTTVSFIIPRNEPVAEQAREQ
jgi:two-component system sensor histidine kinase KdpD